MMFVKGTKRVSSVWIVLPCLTKALSTTSKEVLRSTITRSKSVPGLDNGMEYTMLGSSGLEVSKVCMGTMTFGEQNTLEEGVDQLNLAFDKYGVNFLDTAEIYPVPTKPETQGKTDATVAKFLQGRRRGDVILASKVLGRSDRMTWVRKDASIVKVSREQILESVDSSLQRLGTDYIDLLQIHWPDRYVGGLFGQKDFTASKIYEDTVTFEEQLSTLKEVIDSGKVRYVGVSNETPYGVCSMIHLAQKDPSLYAKIVSIQNSYSLLVRKDFESGLAEPCFYHNVGMLPYSPLGGGILTGKYSDPNKIPEKARLTLFPGFMDRYLGSPSDAATRKYSEIAQECGLTPTQLALSWCYHREHVTSTIIGATTIRQLEENLKSYDIKLDEETMERIEEVYKEFTDPTKV